MTNGNFFLRMFPENAPVEDDIKPYICYTLDDGLIRAIIIDTMIPDCHYGGLTDEVAEWLEKKIIEYPNKPTLVFTHHPPFTTGLAAMDEGFAQADRLAAILKKHEKMSVFAAAICTRYLYLHGRECPV